MAARQAARRCHGRRVSHWGGHERHARGCLHPRAQPNTGRFAFPGRRLAAAGGQEEGLDFVEDAVTRGPIAAFNVNDEDAAGRVSSLRQARLWRKSGRVGLGSSQMPRFARPSGQRRRRGPRAWLSRSFTSPKYPFLRRRWMRESLRGCNSRVTPA
ncbi:hypothetical protein CBM2598_U30017 [Cupriavidus taiwanensis]|uniref:Uncharacterized protein n=1 Tax=Cupriavidus taiwanensis TaxID=164546 RepID=A0A7Z7JIA9_9BURK|nr:hypothetical protein CBM2597_U30017 [Cupriavidus taiwanensis]SOZ96958.1 hypothetical protein CBM2598_U30017 [Cupriavidus taiwanensis]SPC25963.1 hypothetical protein CBM2594_U20150 [Cupriavidus taiwanensis]